jgi:hypothetical protein
MYELNERSKKIPAPSRISRLPISKEGWYVPWFVAWLDGVPDFRVIGPGKVQEAVSKRLCWVCGDHLGQYKTFAIGPMCVVNRNTAEPPSHRECAIYAARACPFLNNPRMRRNEKDMPAEGQPPPGEMIKRNPGATALWTTKHFKLVRDGANGVLFRIGDPTDVAWFAEGRAATLAEVKASISSGLPILMQYAQQEGTDSVLSLQGMLTRAMQYLPAKEA